MTDTATAIRTAPVPTSEHSRLLLAAHQAMRADSHRLITAVNALPDGEPEEARALGRAFAYVVQLIHDHHWAEDDVMYPFIIERVPTFEAATALLEHDHVELDGAMARIVARLRVLTHRATPVLWHDAHRHLADDATTFDELLRCHLHREEDVLVPALDGLNAADQRLLERTESKLASYRHVRMAVPWVLANSTPQEAVELRANAPRLLGIAHDHRWSRRFTRLMAPLYTHPASFDTTQSDDQHERT